MKLIERIKRLFKDQDNRTLLSSFISLSALQGINLVLPLVILPYLVRILGMELYGLIAFSAAFVYYFQVITDYGFNLTATREIAIHRNNQTKIIEIYNSVMIIKLILLLFSFLIMTMIIFSFKVLRDNYEIYYLTFGVVIGNALLPTWLFQGMERMKYMTILNLITKVSFTVLIFIFVTKKEDYLLVPIFTSAGYIISGLLSFLIIKKSFKITLSNQPISVLKTYLKDGWFIFLSQLKITFFSNSNILILGFFTGNIEVGYFSSAEKIIRALSALQTPIVSAMFPYISKNIQKNPILIISRIHKIAKIGTGLYLIIIVSIFLFAENIVLIMFNSVIQQVVLTLRIILIIPLCVFLNNLFGTQILLNLGKDRLFFRVLLMTALINLGLVFPLTYWYSYIGTSISMVISEIFLLSGMYYFAQKIEL
ncbi:flippase [Sediminicola arcticus]|jgi:PST family polysaccharide transporter|uniref:Flippase n=1 Tax=Sediminicola arcticus TaxID=1574308 RepID=A0ABV2SQV7_9FLAO